MKSTEMETVYLTREGLEKLRGELDRLVNTVRPRAAEMMAEARTKGDLSENAEFDAAREELASIDRRISELRSKLNRVQIIDLDSISTETVRVMSTVTLLNLKTGVEVEYTLVDPLQADPANRRISFQSPIAAGLLGKRVGDETAISVPSGELRFRVVGIERARGI